MDINWYEWLGLPLLIFVARLFDVSLGTLRIIFTSRGKRTIAPLLGFVEVFIWVAIIGEISRATSGVLSYFAYAAGFAVGTYIGMKIEDYLALGKLVVRAILSSQGAEVADALHKAGYGVTVVDGRGSSGEVKLIYTIVRRRDLAEVTGLIHHIHPRAFLSVEEVRASQDGIFPAESGGHFLSAIRQKRK